MKKRRQIQILLGTSISMVTILLSWTPFYEMAELRMLDARYQLRGTIPMSPQIATADIDTRTLGVEGRWQDWARDKHARMIETLGALGAKTVCMDMYFPEPSISLLPKEQLAQVDISSREDVLKLFPDHDAELESAMRRAGNVFVGQSFKVSPDQNPEYVRQHIRKRTEQQEEAWKLLEPYLIQEQEVGTIEQYIEMEPPLPRLIQAAKGVGFAQTVSDIDGVVRRYPLILCYDGRLIPSLGLIAACDYVGVSLEQVIVVPGDFVKLPNARFPGGAVHDLTIPIDDKGRMMVNWAGDWWDEHFFHVPAHLLMAPTESSLMMEAAVLKDVKRMMHEDTALMRSPALLLQKARERGMNEGLSEQAYLLVRYASGFEQALQADRSLSLEAFFKAQDVPLERIPPEQRDFFSKIFDQVKRNLSIVEILESQPGLSVEEVAKVLGVRQWEGLRGDVATIRDLLARGGVGPEHHPLYFLSVVLEDRVLLPSDFEGKVFFYGLTATGTHDLNPMPYNARYPMLGLHANALNTILAEQFLIHCPEWLHVLIMLGLGILVGVFVPRFRAVTGALIMLGASVIYFGLVFLFFSSKGIWVDVVGPMGILGIGYLAVTVYNYVAEEKEKGFIRGAFGQFLSPAVVNHLIDHPEALTQLGGETKVMTAFFSDVEGFTSISEALGPQRLVLLLNEYLDKMTHIIADYEGTVDKFEGDAVIAFYGAPIDLADHAQRACLATLDMQAELVTLRAKWREEGFPELFVRIGVNSGQMMVGNMGSYTRMDYTMLGDAVNVAARLEPLNKLYGTYTMIGEDTYKAAESVIEAREVDTVRLVGKADPIVVYELLSRKGKMGETMAEAIRLYREALALYKARRWDEAMAAFGEVLLLSPEDGPSKTYLGRCRQFKVTPPPEDWDGVYKVQTKG
ncbi:MAG: adenylate/guanylate cyclase domain-containing protein [Candidatus Latescibacterota bacterium]